MPEPDSFNFTSRVKSDRLSKQADFNESSERARIILHLIKPKSLSELGSFNFTSPVELTRLIKQSGTLTQIRFI